MKTKTSESRLEKSHLAWAKTRAKGKWHFVLTRGVLLWGGLMFLWMGMLYPYLRHSTREFTLRGLLVSAVIWPLGGLLWGVLVWWVAERNFQKYETRQGKIKQ